MWFDEEYKYGIATKNIPLSPFERKEIEGILNEQGIGFFCLEERGIMNSVFTSIPIYLNPEIISLIINGLMMPAFYDVLKHAIHIMASKISMRVHKNDPSESGAALKFKIGEADIHAEIPSNLNNEQFSSYMDMIANTVSILSKSDENIKKNRQQLFLMYNNDKEIVEIKSTQEYADIQKNRKKL